MLVERLVAVTIGLPGVLGVGFSQPAITIPANAIASSDCDLGTGLIRACQLLILCNDCGTGGAIEHVGLMRIDGPASRRFQSCSKASE